MRRGATGAFERSTVSGAGKGIGAAMVGLELVWKNLSIKASLWLDSLNINESCKVIENSIIIFGTMRNIFTNLFKTSENIRLYKVIKTEKKTN